MSKWLRFFTQNQEWPVPAPVCTPLGFSGLETQPFYKAPDDIHVAVARDDLTVTSPQRIVH